MTSRGAGTEAHRLAGRLANLRRRGRALQLVRDFFARRDFLEIEAPLLVPSPGVELHLDAFAVPDAFAGATRYLITSPEYQLKRLLAAGLDRIYSLGKCFRRGELGPHHNPEFTMVEWYRAPGGWEEIATDVEALVVEVLVGLTDGETRAQKTVLEKVLNEDPQLGDFWGLQLLEAAGFQAQVDIEEMPDGAGWHLACPLQRDPILAHRLTRAQWQEVRRAVARQGAGASDLLAFKLATGLDPAAYDLLPALPYVLGHICAGLGTKAGSAPKSYPLG